MPSDTDPQAVTLASDCYKAPEIPHGDNRPVGEIFPNEICGCGRKVRYISTSDETNACNKYGRCKTWDEWKLEAEKQRHAMRVVEKQLLRMSVLVDIPSDERIILGDLATTLSEAL